MDVMVSGSHGLIGEALCPKLKSRGHSVLRLVRHTATNPDEVSWDPQSGDIADPSLGSADAVIHLAGENIASGRWTQEKKQAIRQSRVQYTRLLAQKLARLDRKPATLICASAIGFYGDSGDRIVDEQSTSGNGFLADLCKDWEDACACAAKSGIRVVNIRIGVVLSPKGGALAKMLLPFELGIGGVIGSGKQFMSWVAVDDVADMIIYAMDHKDIEGPVNAVSTNPVTNAEFTKTLGKVLGRPTICPVPDFGARLVFGEMADELLLSSCRVRPGKLSSSGYQLSYPDLEGALRHVLGKDSSSV